jgi:cation diffusion facilitator CzcD-associated flavoprotein CzcO
MRDGVVIVGAGPAGLAAARALRLAGLRPRILERGGTGHTWANLYDSLSLHTGRHMSTLPGLSFDGEVPLFPTRPQFLEYLRRYRERFDLVVEDGTTVERAYPPVNGGPWRLDTSKGSIEADALVFATGIVADPVTPTFPGALEYRGRRIHAVDYRRPDPYRGRRVLVVGVGNSGGEIASELAACDDIAVTIAVRSGANVVPLTMAGVPIQYIAAGLFRLPRAVRARVIALIERLMEARRGPPALPRLGWSEPPRVPLIGFHLDDAILAGRVAVRPGVERFTPVGVGFVNGEEEPFDDVILATGYRAALQPLDGLVRRDARGFALRTDSVTSADQPRLFFIGQNYDVTGAIANIARDSTDVARAVARALR